MKIILPLFMVLLLVSYSTAQDTTAIGIAQGDKWEFEIVQGEYEYGTNFKLEAGDTYSFEVVTDPDDTGEYEFLIDAEPGPAAGRAHLDEFGNEAVYTDWTYWEENVGGAIEEEYEFTGGLIDIDNGEEVFSANYTVNIVALVAQLNISYYKSTGVMKHFYFLFSSILIDDDTTFEIENLTGADPDSGIFGSLPVFEVGLVGIAFATIVLINRRKN